MSGQNPLLDLLMATPSAPSVAPTSQYQQTTMTAPVAPTASPQFGTSFTTTVTTTSTATPGSVMVPCVLCNSMVPSEQIALHSSVCIAARYSPSLQRKNSSEEVQQKLKEDAQRMYDEYNRLQRQMEALMIMSPPASPAFGYAPPPVASPASPQMLYNPGVHFQQAQPGMPQSPIFYAGYPGSPQIMTQPIMYAPQQLSNSGQSPMMGYPAMYTVSSPAITQPLPVYSPQQQTQSQLPKSYNPFSDPSPPAQRISLGNDDADFYNANQSSQSATPLSPLLARPAMTPSSPLARERKKERLKEKHAKEGVVPQGLPEDHLRDLAKRNEEEDQKKAEQEKRRARTKSATSGGSARVAPKSTVAGSTIEGTKSTSMRKSSPRSQPQRTGSLRDMRRKGSIDKSAEKESYLLEFSSDSTDEDDDDIEHSSDDDNQDSDDDEDQESKHHHHHHHHHHHSHQHKEKEKEIPVGAASTGSPRRTRRTHHSEPRATVNAESDLSQFDGHSPVPSSSDARSKLRKLKKVFADATVQPGYYEDRKKRKERERRKEEKQRRHLGAPRDGQVVVWYHKHKKHYYEYDKLDSERLEWAFQRGHKTTGLDSMRFVDFKRWVQRSYVDPMARTKIKRRLRPLEHQQQKAKAKEAAASAQK